MKNIAFIGRVNPCNANPGDLMIFDTVKYHIDTFFSNLNQETTSIFQDSHGQSPETWKLIENYADIVVVCGLPQLHDNNKDPDLFDSNFFKRLWSFRRQGKTIWNLFCGFTAQSQNLDFAQSTESILKAKKEYISRNYSVFHKIITRDRITERVLQECNLPCLHIPDSVFWCPKVYNISPSEKNKTVIILKNLADQPLLAESLVTLADNFDDPVFLCTTATDYNFFADNLYFYPVLCITNPRELIKFYSTIHTAVSMRIHATVPLVNFSPVLSHIYYDSRRASIESCLNYSDNSFLIKLNDFIQKPTLAIPRLTLHPSVSLTEAENLIQDYLLP